VLRDERIQIYESFDAFCYPIGHSSDDHAAVGMTSQDNLVEFFSFNAADNVSNVSFERDCLARGMGALADASECRRDRYVTPAAQLIRRVPIAPASVPCSMHEDKVGHHNLRIAQDSSGSASYIWLL
jgi:hypothetical protein